jgi:hypothetical protein
MPVLHVRDYNDDMGWTSSGGARWAFFAIFIVFIIIVVLGTLRVNKKRTQHGVQPLYGTRWMTPPSYMQSQHQQNRQNRDPEGSTYVPTYTAEPNTVVDMGYYDANGEFHAAKQSSVSGPTFTGLGSGTDLPQPPSTHNRQQSGSDGVALGPVPPISPHAAGTDDGPHSIDEDSLGPPPGPPPPLHLDTPPVHTFDSFSHPLYDEDDFRRPSGPPRRSTVPETPPFDKAVHSSQ